MKLFVTGVAGQLGHDVMNELDKRGYEGVGSDLAPSTAESRMDLLLPECLTFPWILQMQLL